jgi:hypothetical protein
MRKKQIQLYKLKFMKKMALIFRIPLLTLLSGALLFTSCNKDKEISAADELGTIESIEDDAAADISYSSSTDEALDLGMQENPDLFGYPSPTYSTDPNPSPRLSGNVSGRLQRCYTVTIDSTLTSKTVTIDFGSGCTGRDGRLRKGKIITVYTGRLRFPGSKATTTFDNYYVDSIKVDGMHIFSNISSNSIPTYQREIKNGQLTWPSGRWVKRDAIRTVAMIKGASTLNDRTDDEFAITGSGKGENSRGKTWAHEITEDLIKRTTCRWISKGILQFRHNAAVGTLNYGDGTCDNEAVLTVNGRTKIITLR